MACPICDGETEAQFRPFCSKRCADVDLAKWLTGSYAIPSQDEDDAENLAEALDDAAQNDLNRLH
jgi:endogenous inhibitor of DNA gyrase (YacG/DUF329 family)